MENNQHNLIGRPQWNSQFGFLMAAAGSAIGLGNLWRFPYLVGVNGGGIFVLLYLLILVIIGIPLMLTEISIGQYGKSDAYGSYVKVSPKIGAFGLMALLCAFLILCYYGTVGGWVAYYMVVYSLAIFGGQGVATGNAGNVFSEMISSPGLAISWHVVFTFSVILIVLGGLEKGTERASKIMMPALFVILLILAIISMTRAGASAGLDFYLKPDLSKLSLGVLGEALGQVFFSLSLGMAAIVTYGSYLSEKQSSKRNSVIIPLFDTGVALLAGLVIFPAVFAAGLQPGSGPGLVFVTLPEVFSKLPMGNFIAFAFFVAVFFAAVSSAISLLEAVVAYFVDQKKLSRPKVALFLGVTAALIGIMPALSIGDGPLAGVTIRSLLGNPAWMEKIQLFNLASFDLLDYITGRIMLPLGGLALCITGGWIMGKQKLLKIITQDGKRSFKLADVYFFVIKYLAPVAILIVLLQSLVG
ncbi:MAG: sodium-dependent transporter [Spirochaetia bacterium]